MPNPSIVPCESAEDTHELKDWRERTAMALPGPRLKPPLDFRSQRLDDVNERLISRVLTGLGDKGAIFCVDAYRASKSVLGFLQQGDRDRAVREEIEQAIEPSFGVSSQVGVGFKTKKLKIGVHRCLFSPCLSERIAKSGETEPAEGGPLS